MEVGDTTIAKPQNIANNDTSNSEARRAKGVIEVNVHRQSDDHVARLGRLLPSSL